MSKNLLRPVFSRFMLIVLILLGQIYLLFEIFARINARYATWILFLFSIFSAVCIIAIINSHDNPAFKLMWMIPLSVVPVFGVVLYLFVKFNPIRFGQAKSLRYRIEETKAYLQTKESVIHEMKKEKVPISDLSYYIQHVNHFPTYNDTTVAYFPSGEDYFENLIEELQKAEKYIFMEYFIINRGKAWDEVLAILKEKAAQGVEVRILYDGFNSLTALPWNYGKHLSQYGIKVREFAPVRPFLSSHQNFRDHRKIVIIDGKVAFNGGINLADEYMNLIERFGYWKDTAVKLEGNASKSFTAMFLQMWGMQDAEAEDYARYLSEAEEDRGDIIDRYDSDWSSEDNRSNGLGYIIPYNDDPCNKQDIAEEVYLDILNKARDYVWIMTPYLIPENEMITGLCFAAQRGVDVRIIMPHIEDKRIPFDIAHSYYLQLMEAGVKIYEFIPGFVHAKMFLSDDCKAVVGTINLDFRSLYEHFECATFIYGNPVVDEIKVDYLKTFEQCKEFEREDYKKIPLLRRISGRVFRLFAPLM